MTKKRSVRVCVLALAVVVAVVAVGVTVAFLFRKTDKVDNTLKPAEVTCKVVETFDGTTKSEIKVQNIGNIPAFLRVRLVSYWVDNDGNIVGKESVMPVFTPAEDWVKIGEDTYGYASPVAPDALTPNLLAGDMTLVAEDGCHQVVEVFAEGIQSAPDKAVQQAWGVQVEDGKITGE